MSAKKGKKRGGAVADPPKAHVSKEGRVLHCDLTDTEKADARVKVLDLLGQRETIEADKKAAVAEYTSKLKNVDKEVARLRKAVAGGEERLVDCERTMDFERAKVTVVRLDTGEKVENRDMHPSEKQLPLDHAAPGDGEEADPSESLPTPGPKEKEEGDGE